MINSIAAPPLSTVAGALPARQDPAPTSATAPAGVSADTAGHPNATHRAGLGDPLEKAIDAVNSSLQAGSTGIRFEIDAETRRVVVSIIDSETGDTLRTVPSDAVIRVARMIAQLQGQGIDTTA